MCLNRYDHHKDGKKIQLRELRYSLKFTYLESNKIMIQF